MFIEAFLIFFLLKQFVLNVDTCAKLPLLLLYTYRLKSFLQSIWSLKDSKSGRDLVIVLSNENIDMHEVPLYVQTLNVSCFEKLLSVIENKLSNSVMFKIPISWRQRQSMNCIFEHDLQTLKDSANQWSVLLEHHITVAEHFTSPLIAMVVWVTGTYLGDNTHTVNIPLSTVMLGTHRIKCIINLKDFHIISFRLILCHRHHCAISKISEQRASWRYFNIGLWVRIPLQCLLHMKILTSLRYGSLFKRWKSWTSVHVDFLI